MSSDRPPKDPTKSKDLPPDLLETDEGFATEDLPGVEMDDAETGYAVRPRTPAEENRVQATLDTEDVVVLLPTEETHEAEVLPEIEVVGDGLGARDFLQPGSGLRSDLTAETATESIGDGSDFGFGIPDELGVPTETATAAVSTGAQTETGAWSLSDLGTITETEELPELEDVEDITAMLPEDGGFDLVSPSEDFDSEGAFFTEEEPAASSRSWLSVLVVAAVLVGAAYFGLDFYRDRLDSKSGAEVARAGGIAGTEGPKAGAGSDGPETDPVTPDPTDALAMDPLNPGAQVPNPLHGDSSEQAPSDRTPDPTVPLSSDAPESSDEFRTWVGRSLVSHFNLNVEEKN